VAESREIAEFKGIYSQLKDQLRWKVSDGRVLMTIASGYVMSKKDFQLERFLQTADAIKKEAGLFSTMRSESRYMIAAILDSHFDKPEAQISDLFRTYEACIRYGFSRGVYTFLSAAVLIANCERLAPETVMDRAKQIHQAMRSEHVFLTSAEDYPLAVLLAYESDGPTIIQKTEQFYRQLNSQGFHRGNDLQFASHILGLEQKTNETALTSRAVQYFDAFKKNGIKLKTKHYPLLALLAFLLPAEVDIAAIHELYDELNGLKGFRWQKDLNLMLAVSFYAKDRIEQADVAETSLYTTLEMILQAQQAAMSAAVIAASASASSSSNH